MATLIHKKKKGHEYTYWDRVQAGQRGKPRIVEQVYLGPKQRILEEIKAAYTRGRAPGPAPLRQVRVLEFGASAWVCTGTGPRSCSCVRSSTATCAPPDPKPSYPTDGGSLPRNWPP